LRVLFAEDDRINRFTGVRLLESLGCVVTAVNDGREAVEALADDTYDVLLMDVQMPVLDGVGATRAIRDGKAGPGTSDIPIIALTAFAMEGDREHLLEAGMDDYLSKPVERGTLLQVLRRFAPSA
jgi:CheY-like chemotaxis protein